MRVPYQQFARRPDLVDWTDLTTSVVTGPAFPTVDGEWIDIPFEPDITDPELHQRILLRLQTPSTVEEDQTVRARQALTNLKALRDTTGTLTAAQLSTGLRLCARVLIVLIIRYFRLRDAE